MDAAAKRAGRQHEPLRAERQKECQTLELPKFDISGKWDMEVMAG